MLIEHTLQRSTTIDPHLSHALYVFPSSGGELLDSLEYRPPCFLWVQGLG